MREDNKFALLVYLWGTISGVVSGWLALYSKPAWIVGALMYLLTDAFVLRLMGGKLPEDLREVEKAKLRGAVLKKAFWGWLLFWLYFTMLVYTVGIHFSPVPYSNQSLLAQSLNTTGG